MMANQLSFLTSDNKQVIVPFESITCSPFLHSLFSFSGKIRQNIDQNQNIDENQNIDQNIITTEITSEGFNYIGCFTKNNKWPIHAYDKGSIIKDMTFDEALDFLMIEDSTLSMYSFLIFLEGKENHDITLCINSNSYSYLTHIKLLPDIDHAKDWLQFDIVSFSPSLDEICNKINNQESVMIILELNHPEEIECLFSFESLYRYLSKYKNKQIYLKFICRDGDVFIRDLDCLKPDFDYDNSLWKEMKFYSFDPPLSVLESDTHLIDLNICISLNANELEQLIGLELPPYDLPNDDKDIDFSHYVCEKCGSYKDECFCIKPRPRINVRGMHDSNVRGMHDSLDFFSEEELDD
jgi:hypothetical protein